MKKGIQKIRGLALLFLALGFPSFAEEHPPLAPPSSLALSMEDMILHFKIFVIADLFRKISGTGIEEKGNFFELTDVELNLLLNEAARKEPMLQNIKNLNLFFLNRELYMNLENKYYKCFRLEVLPEEFEFRIESVQPASFKASMAAQKKGEAK